MICALLSEKFEKNEKFEILENEHRIPVNDGLRNEVNLMCNLSQGIEERAVEKTTESFITGMYDNNIPVYKIAVITGKNENEIRAILKRK